MRYGQRGGYTPAEQQRRERLRLEAGGRFAAGDPVDEEVLRDVIDRTGAVEIHPFDDERVIAGAGTAALELMQEYPDLDVVVTPIGGGGLCSGRPALMRSASTSLGWR